MASFTQIMIWYLFKVILGNKQRHISKKSRQIFRDWKR